MIVFGNIGNPYGLKVKICIEASNSSIKYQEFTSEGKLICPYIEYLIF